MFTRKLSKLFETIALFIFRWKYPVLTVSCLLLLTAFSLAKNIKLDPSLDALLPEDHHVLRVMQEASDHFGHVDNHVLVVKSPDFDAGKRFVDAIHKDFEALDEVEWTAYKSPNEFFEKNIMLYLDLEDIKLFRNRLNKKIEAEKSKARTSLLLDLDDEEIKFEYGDILDKYKTKYKIQNKKSETDYFHYYYPNKKEHVFALLIRPVQSALDMGFANRLVKLSEELVKAKNPSSFHKNMKVAFTGRYKKKPESFNALKNDFTFITLLSVGCVLVVMLFYFRSFWQLFLIFSSLIVGIIFTLGIAQAVIGSLNLVTTFLVAILLGLGIDFGIHFLLRFKEEIERGNEPQFAFVTMFKETGIASITAALTTAAAFIGLTFSGFAAFSEFGFIASVGVLSILFSYMVFMSPLMLILSTTFKLNLFKANVQFKYPARLWAKPKWTLAFGGGLSLVALIGFFLIRFDYDFSKLMAADKMPSYALDKEITKIFNRALSSPSLVIVNAPEDEKKLLENLKTRVDSGEAKHFERVIGISTFIPENQKEKLREIQKIKYLIQNNRKYFGDLDPQTKKNLKTLESKLINKQIRLQDLPDFIRYNFKESIKNPDRRKLLLYSSANLGDGLEVLEFSEFLNSIHINDKPVKVAATSLIFAEILKLIRQEGFFILIVIFISIYVLSSGNLSSFMRGGLVLLPISLGVLWLVGIQGLAGIKLNFINIIVYPITIGIGIDSGIHLYHRYLESGDIVEAVQTTGQAISLSALTTLVAFGSLSFSENEVVKSLGLSAALGISLTYVASLMVLPAIILLQKIRAMGKK